jgi:hypothetical protein
MAAGSPCCDDCLQDPFIGAVVKASRYDNRYDNGTGTEGTERVTRRR